MNIKALYYPLIVIILGRILFPVLVINGDSAFFNIAFFTAALIFGTVILLTWPLLKSLSLWLKIISIIIELSVLFFIFIYCFLMAYIFQPWPISAIQGPNTAYAWHGYKFLLRDQSQTEVDNVYFHSRWQGWGDGSARILRFDCKDKTAFAKTLLTLPQPSLQDISLRDAPSWWLQGNYRLIEIEPPQNDQLKNKWIEPETCRTYIKSGQWYG